MAVQGERVTVGVTESLLAGGAGGDVSCTVRNRGTVACDVGPSGVVAGAGFEIEAGASVSIDLDPDERLYGIVAAGTTTIHVLRNRV